jgi:hypothetical protein
MVTSGCRATIIRLERGHMPEGSRAAYRLVKKLILSGPSTHSTLSELDMVCSIVRDRLFGDEAGIRRKDSQ